MRLVKDLRLSLRLTEVMKIARLTSPLLEAPHQSSPRPRLRHGRRLALLFHPNLTLDPVHSLLRSIAGSSSSSSSSSNFPNCFSPRESASVYAAYLRSHFSFFGQRPCIAEPEATSLSFAEPRALMSLIRPSALLSPSLNFFRLPPTFSGPLPLVQTKLPIPC